MLKLVKIEGSRINVPEPEYLTVGTNDIVAGEGLVLSSGKLVNCGTNKPTFVALANTAKNTEAAVGRVTPDYLFDVELDTNVSALVAGSKVALVSGLKVGGNVSESGVATVVDTLGAAKAGETIRVRFV